MCMLICTCCFDICFLHVANYIKVYIVINNQLDVKHKQYFMA